MAYSEQMWAEAKKKCRLNNDDIALAKRLGLNPQSLIKNIPSKSEPWKAPVKDWLHEIDAKRQKKSAQEAAPKGEIRRDRRSRLIVTAPAPWPCFCRGIWVRRECQIFLAVSSVPMASAGPVSGIGFRPGRSGQTFLCAPPIRRETRF